MKRFYKYQCLLHCILLNFALPAFFSRAEAQKENNGSKNDYSRLVNPFIGTGGHGHTYPGASMPFGMMQLSPDTRMADWDGSSGYHYSDSVIYGFSHTHLSGTGIPDYCDILFMPFSGKVQWDKNDYRSTFSHKNEKACPGYYEVLLEKNKINARLTSSVRSGMHEYTFSNGNSGSVLIDLSHRDEVLESWIEKVSPTEIKGMRRSRSWARDQYIYFYARFESPIKEWIVLDENGLEQKTELVKGKKLKASISFDLPSNKIQKIKIGISAVSAEGAKNNLDTEIADWNFDKLHQSSMKAWNKELGKVEVKGGTKDQQSAFYTALYHCFLVPNIFQDVDGQYRGTDLKIHKAENFTNYSVFSLWDTYRAYHPLMTILNQDRTVDWVNGFLSQHKNGGMLPVWELAGNETFCMIGYHSVPVILDAYKKGLFKGRENEFLEAMTSYAESNRYGLEQYRKRGYISNEKEHESVSKTLEYAYDDWCISEFARLTGNIEVQKKYLERSQFYMNLFDPQTKHMRGKVQGQWYAPFDPKEINNFYTEANAWQYSFAVPHDINHFIKLHGGKMQFAAKLNELFSTSSQTTGREQADITGLIGQYAQGNEPSHHMAYLFNYVGMPWRTQEIVNKINNEFYLNSPDGLIGNEDCGQMSAWFVFSAMGFYPVCPGDGTYVLGTPLFSEVKLNLENGKQFIITSSAKNKNEFYISSVSLNGKEHAASFIEHDEIMKGGKMHFQLQNKPNASWAVNEKDLPVSEIRGERIIPVPFFDIASNKFRDSLSVSLKCIDEKATIYYSVIYQDKTSRVYKYEKPFLIDRSCTIESYAAIDKKESRKAEQSFYRIMNDYAITVSSEVHPMYTAGGPGALIDGMKGTENWRTGEWQSYFNRDFEAIVDLKKNSILGYVGIHVLEDISPWIMYPQEVIFYTSTDGKTFTEAGRVKNESGKQPDSHGTKEIGLKLSLETRYIKIRAINGGKLPAWHESAGSPSHLFIDEIVIREGKADF
jgi:predicted alpha-1,2-mannosidase